MRWKNLLYYTLGTICQLSLCLLECNFVHLMQLACKRDYDSCSCSSSEFFMMMLWI